MSATSRELVWQALRFEGPARAPRQLWLLPWAQLHYPDEVAAISAKYPSDISGAPGFHREQPPTQGNNTAVGTFIDEFGCVFINIQEGVIGEVKDPMVKDWDADVARVHIPREQLTIDIDKVNAWCAKQDAFTMAGYCPRPFEQTQFIRGSAELYVDLMMQPPSMMQFLKQLHDFYCETLECWAKTDVDALSFMDDWGSQQSLLIDPRMWRELFKPMYRDYIQIAHGAGKAIFMHSDGYTADIYPDLIELGLDAFNSQIFCIGVDKLAQYAGKITFWGEIDRQHLLVEGTPEEVTQAVRLVYNRLWKNGGCIAQCEFGAGANPAAIEAVFAAWDALTTGGG